MFVKGEGKKKNDGDNRGREKQTGCVEGAAPEMAFLD